MSGARATCAIVGGMLLLAGCTPAQNGSVEGGVPASVVSADSRVTMQRLPCFGTCPVYTIEIGADGAVSFNGERHVDSIGRAAARIDAAAAASLMRELVDAGFYELDEKYTMDAKGCGPYHTDAPRVIMTVRVDGREKTVEHDYGCGSAPAALRIMQEHVDSVADAARWVGRR